MDWIAVFEMGRGDDVDLEVTLNREWARERSDVQLAFPHGAGDQLRRNIDANNASPISSSAGLIDEKGSGLMAESSIVFAPSCLRIYRLEGTSQWAGI